MKKISEKTYFYYATKESKLEVCPKCATPSFKVHDRVKIKVKDAPLRGKHTKIIITKRRFRCPQCKSVFTEPVQGIKKGFRTTQKFRRHLLHACDRYSNLKNVQRDFKCSAGLIYKICYEQLALELRKRQTPWPKTVGIDEHSFRKNIKYSKREFATIFVDYSNSKIKEVLLSKHPGELEALLMEDGFEGRENVRHVVIDLSKDYKKLVRSYFPNAHIVADRFHVMRLIHKVINKYRLEITGDNRRILLRKYLLKDSRRLQPWVKREIQEWLSKHPILNEVYQWKEKIYRFYRIKGSKYARKQLQKLTDTMSLSSIPEIRTLRETLHKWREEILRFFSTGITNGRTEGFNRKAKLIQRMAYGYRNFSNYRLRLILSCK